MNHHPDRLTDDAITRLLRTRSADPEPRLLDDIMRAVGTAPQDRPWPGLRTILIPRRTLLIVAIAMLLATLGAIAVGSRLVQQDRLRDERLTIIGQVIDAMNSRDVGSLRTFFVADGFVEFPGVDARPGREGDLYRHNQPLSEGQRVEGWMRLLDRWDMEAQLGSCRIQAQSTISCGVATRWHVLQLEIGEEWTFDFDGALVMRLDMMARVDPDPANRVLPLGLVDLERWGSWLRETHPEQVDRLLPTGPDIFAHYYFRFGLDESPDEIGASIREYVREAQP